MKKDSKLKDEPKNPVRDSIKLASSSLKIAAMIVGGAISPMIGGAFITGTYDFEKHKEDYMSDNLYTIIKDGFRRKAANFGAVTQMSIMFTTGFMAANEDPGKVTLSNPESNVEIVANTRNIGKTYFRENMNKGLYIGASVFSTIPLIDLVINDKKENIEYGSLEIKTTADIEGLSSGKKDVFCRYFLKDVGSSEQIREDVDLRNEKLQGVWIDDRDVNWNKQMVSEPFREYFENIENQGVEACIKDFESEFQGKNTYEVNLK